MEVGFLHPGLMGETLAANCVAPAVWASAGRSAETAERAAAHGLVDTGSLQGMCERVDTIVSICPPGAAEDLAVKVAACGFEGIYVDANAISPATARSISARFEQYVDGSVVGPPARTAGSTRLFLSGNDAGAVAALWKDSLLETVVLDGGPGAASALKMAYATWTKVSSALLLDVCALAEHEGVADALIAEWERSQPGTVERSNRVAQAVSPKAWRFVAEMEQIAASFGDAGLPSGFAEGAGEVYERMAGFKGRADATLPEVMASLVDLQESS